MVFEEFSIEWALISGFIGSVLTLFLKYLFDEQITTYTRKLRANRELVKVHTKPLLVYGYSLERRINNFIRNHEKEWLISSQYYELTTMFLFAQFFSQIHIIESELDYLEYNQNTKSNEFNLKIRKLFFSLTSHKTFELNADFDTEGTVLQRFVITAIGESATVIEGEKRRPMRLLEFQDHYKNFGNRNVWYEYLFQFLLNALKKETGAICFDRLILFGMKLHELNLSLDKKQLIVKNTRPSNTELITNSLKK